MRWRIDAGGMYTRMIDADFTHVEEYIPWRRGDVTFVRGGKVVFTISGSVYVPIKQIPTMRLIDGPRAGQVASTTWETPYVVYFEQAVPLKEDGTALCPVPPSELRDQVDVYVHSEGCPCGLWRRGHVEHEYVWSEQQRAAAEDGEP